MFENGKQNQVETRNAQANAQQASEATTNSSSSQQTTILNSSLQIQRWETLNLQYYKLVACVNKLEWYLLCQALITKLCTKMAKMYWGNDYSPLFLLSSHFDWCLVLTYKVNISWRRVLFYVFLIKFTIFFIR